MFQEELNIFVPAQTIQSGHLNDRVDVHAGFSSIDRCAEQPVLAANGNRPDAVFRPVVGQRASAILEIGHHLLTAIAYICDRLCELSVTGHDLSVRPLYESVDYRLLMFETALHTGLRLEMLLIIAALKVE